MLVHKNGKYGIYDVNMHSGYWDIIVEGKHTTNREIRFWNGHVWTRPILDAHVQPIAYADVPSEIKKQWVRIEENTIVTIQREAFDKETNYLGMAVAKITAALHLADFSLFKYSLLRKQDDHYSWQHNTYPCALLYIGYRKIEMTDAQLLKVLEANLYE